MSGPAVDPMLATAYLDLLKRSLTRLAFPDGRWDADLVRVLPFDAALRTEGLDWPTEAETMIGMARLQNLQACVEGAIRDGVPGDLVETGVWRGGAGILMRGVLKAYNDTGRTVWLADSFAGLPRPSGTEFPADSDDRHWMLAPYLAVSQDTVRQNFARYGLLDDQVKLLPGWFSETLPHAPIGAIAVLRLDGDMYESTIVALESLYSKVSPGGFVIVDDFGALPNCRRAVEDYRRAQGIDAPITAVDWTGVYWRKP